MSSKKTKGKVSQADLRKMMQQLKNKKGDVHTYGGKEKTDVSIKRKFTDQTYLNKPSKIKKSVGSSAPVTVASFKTNISSNQSILQKKEHVSKRSYDQINSQINEKLSKSHSKVQKVVTKNANNKITTSLVGEFYSESDDSSDEHSINAISKTDSHQSTVAIMQDDNNKNSLESSLPAGFFDDPEVDAKIRGVETPADKLDREWESFQRELKHETGQSEQLINEEHETGHLDREIDEIDEQIHYYNLIDKLFDQKDAVLEKVVNSHQKDVNQMEVDSSSDEIDEDLLDWREKDAFN